MKTLKSIDRRNFMRSTAIIATGTLGLTSIPNTGWTNVTTNAEDRINVIGPREGFAPHVGSLFSMMTWMRTAILSPVRGMTTEQLDYIHDDKSNSIGSMLFHLAATERFYQIHTFEGKKWGEWSETDSKKFGVAMSLGDEARKTIKGNNLDYYLNILNEVRGNTLNLKSVTTNG